MVPSKETPPVNNAAISKEVLTGLRADRNAAKMNLNHSKERSSADFPSFN